MFFSKWKKFPNFQYLEESISNIFSWNSEANASEFQENMSEMSVFFDHVILLNVSYS